jgi:hypothetical protein
MGAKDQGHSDRASERRRKGRSDPIEGLKVTMIVEGTEPGSALDMRLRQEQAKAVFDLLAATRPDAKDN